MAGGGIRSVLETWFSPHVRRRCGLVALIVGSILNLINQGDVLLKMGSPNWFKLVLTYLVPYFVCAFGAISAVRKPDR